MAPVPLLTANGRCGLGEGTFATPRGKGRLRCAETGHSHARGRTRGFEPQQSFLSPVAALSVR